MTSGYKSIEGNMTYACRILDKAQKTGGKANEENPKIGATQEKGTRNEGCCVIAGLSKRWGMRGWKRKGQKGHRPDGPPTTLWFLF